MKNVKELVSKKVRWLCKPHGKESFVVTGEVLKVKMVVFGGHKKKWGAQIKVSSKKYVQTMKKQTTVVAVDKLSLV